MSVNPTTGRAESRPAIAGAQDAELVTILVRSTLFALHHANVTGNYTVLRDLAAPAFRRRNSAADLSIIFAPLRENGIDLELIAVRPIELNYLPIIDASDRLSVSGYFDSGAVLTKFDIMYQVVDGFWTMLEISVSAEEISVSGNLSENRIDR